MGTNYYWYPKRPCECCERPFEPVHIGKSSGGWCFSLHIILEDGIHDLETWAEKFMIPGSYILNEYKTEISVPEMMDIITQRSWTRKACWTTTEYEQNHAEPGPNGLVRHKVDGRHCVNHGQGTWDCIVGEFS